MKIIRYLGSSLAVLLAAILLSAAPAWAYTDDLGDDTLVAVDPTPVEEVPAPVEEPTEDPAPEVADPVEEPAVVEETTEPDPDLYSEADVAGDFLPSAAFCPLLPQPLLDVMTDGYGEPCQEMYDALEAGASVEDVAAQWGLTLIPT